MKKSNAKKSSKINRNEISTVKIKKSIPHRTLPKKVFLLLHNELTATHYTKTKSILIELN